MQREASQELEYLVPAPTPEQGRRLTRAAVGRALVGADRRRNVQARVVAVHDALSASQLAARADRGGLPRGGRRLGGHAPLPERAGRRAGTAPATRSSGLRTVVVARAACNQRLADACYLWAFAALTASPGARPCHDAHRARGQTHHQAPRALGNRLVGILHGCLVQRVTYRSSWPGQCGMVGARRCRHARRVPRFTWSG
jgi:hypothetical protein